MSETSKIEDQKISHNHDAIIEIAKVKKSFKVGNNLIQALRGVDLNIHATDFLVIFGPSGCGKSTLLNIISGIDTPSDGKVTVRGTNIFNLSEDERGKFRSEKMGLVHQLPYWVKSLTVLENVALPLIIEGEKPQEAKRKARSIMTELKISDLINQFPTQLSGGQQQKVGIARALVSNPWILLADEPTGNLDSVASDEIMKLFETLNRENKRTIILVTHNQAYWNIGTRRIEMRDGEIVKEVNHG